MYSIFFQYACQNNYPSTVRLLVQLGSANIQARNTETGDVPLHDAASRGHKEVVKELLSLNAPVNPRNNDNLVPAQLARANNFIECAEILGEYRKICLWAEKDTANKGLEGILIV